MPKEDFPDFVTTKHGAQRQAQRAVADEHVQLVLMWGTPTPQRKGRTCFYLGKKEAAVAQEAGVVIPSRAVNLGVIVGHDQVIVTTIRSRDRHRMESFGSTNRGRRGRSRSHRKWRD